MYNWKTQQMMAGLSPSGLTPHTTDTHVTPLTLNAARGQMKAVENHPV